MTTSETGSRLFGATAFRLALVTLAAFIAAAALVVGYVFPRTSDLITRTVLQTISAEVEGLREQFESGRRSALTITLAKRSERPGAGLYYLADAHGRKLAGNLSQIPPEIRSGAAGGVFRYVRRIDTGIEERLAAGVIIAVRDGTLLVVARDIEEQLRYVASLRRAALWGLALLLGIGLGGGLLISRHMLKRIDAVSDASARIMAGDLSGRIALTGSGDELDRLAQNLNAMLERIEQLMAGMREVSDNIAHDLKTPLNRLRNRAEAALRDPEGPAGYRGGLERIIEEADDLIKTFNALLSIARLEAGAIEETLAPIALGAVIGDVTDLYEPAAEEAGCRLKVVACDEVIVNANRELLGQALANLIDNAIKYAPAAVDAHVDGCGAGDCEINVALRRVSDAVELVVGDRGPGIAAQDRARVLGRFVRLEASRSRPGSGLGLSLVAAVARLHGGSVRLEDNAPGLRVVMSLPLSSQAIAQPKGVENIQAPESDKHRPQQDSRSESGAPHGRDRSRSPAV